MSLSFVPFVVKAAVEALRRHPTFNATWTELDGPVTRLAGPDSPASPNALPLEQAFMLSPAKIAAAIRTLAAY